LIFKASQGFNKKGIQQSSKALQGKIILNPIRFSKKESLIKRTQQSFDKERVEQYFSKKDPARF